MNDKREEKLYHAAPCGTDVEAAVKELAVAWEKRVEDKMEKLQVSARRFQYPEPRGILRGDVRKMVDRHLVVPFKVASGNAICRIQTGFLETDPGAPDGDWHRDVYPLSGWKTGDPLWLPDAQWELPPHYFTLLVDITPPGFGRGVTEFKFDPLPVHAPVCRVFDGRAAHRGTLNDSHESRVMFFATATSPCYYDYTVEDLRRQAKILSRKQGV